MNILKLSIFILTFGLLSACPFCNDKTLSAQTIAETKHCVALTNIKQVVDGMCLIIPKRHIEDFADLSNDEILEIHALANKLHKAVKEIQGHAIDFRLSMNSGPGVGRTVPHIHFHFVPNMYSQNPLYFQIKFYLTYPFSGPVSDKELSKLVEKFAQVLKKY